MTVIRGRSPSEKRPDMHLPGVVSLPFALPATFPPQLRSAAQPLRSKRGSIQLAHAVAALVRRRGRSVVEKGGENLMTERQEQICRLISQEIQQIKRKCENPTQKDYIYWCGYRDGLSKAHELAQFAKGIDGGDPLFIPMLELGVHNTRYRAK